MTADGRTEAEAREWERNRVAWNLPREVRAETTTLDREAAEEPERLADAADGATDDG